jgi:hypothetical protein
MVRSALPVVLLLLGAACERRADEAAPAIDETKLNARHGTGTGAGPIVPARGPATAPSPSTPVPIELGDEGSCTLSIASPLALEDRGPGGRFAASSDYWVGEDELVVAAKRSAAATGVDPETLDPRRHTLRLSCVGERARVDLAPTPRSRYADVPFRPQAYTIGSTGEAGVWTAMGTLDGVTYTRASGELRLARFDATGVAGRFHVEFTGQGGAEALVIDGGFDFRCPREFTKCAR